MLKSITSSSITASIAAVAVAAAVAGLVVVLTSAAPGASAAPAIDGIQQVQAEGATLSTRTSGSACSSLSWPNYEQSCQFDLRGPAHMVRTIALQ